MQLRDLLTIDVDTLSASQAKAAAKDIIATLAKGGLPGEEQN